MKKFSIESRLLSGFGAAMLLLLAAGWLTVYSLQQYIHTAGWVAHDYKVLDALVDVRSSVRELESEQRAYFITGEAQYLTEQERDISQVREQLARIEQLTSDFPHQHLLSSTLSELTETRLRVLNATLEVFRNEGFEAVRQRMRSGVSRLSMAALIRHIDGMDEETRNILRARTEEAQQAARQAMAVSASLVLLALSGLIILWLQTRREVREREAAEAAVYENERLLSKVLELIPVGVFISNLSGQFTRINPAAEAILGLGTVAVDKEEWNRYFGVFHPSDMRLYQPEELPALRSLQGAEIDEEEMYIRNQKRPDGVYISVSSRPLRDEQNQITGVVAVLHNLTEKRKAEQSLRETNELRKLEEVSRGLLEAAPDAMVVVDANGIIKMLNAQTEHMFGYARADLIGKGIETLIPQRFRKQHPQHVQNFVHAPHPRAMGQGLDLFGRRRDGTELPIEVALSPMQSSEGMLITAAIRDISERKRAEQVRAKNLELEVENRRVKEASRLKSEFLANMSHELRTPLNAIIGFSEVLKDGLMGELSAQQKDGINDIFSSGKHLLALINDILDLSKIEAGKMHLNLEALQITPLLQNCLQVVRELAMAQKLQLSAELADDLSDELGEIWLDQRKTKQILYNLLSNAVKFTPEGGKVCLRARRVMAVEVADARFEHYLELAISDSGIGISSQDQSRLFEAFTQIDSSLARRHQGTGLGLAMVRRLTELHGGTVHLDSLPGQGSTFTIRLPWRSGPDQVAAVDAVASTPLLPIPEESSALAASATGKLLALVLEDDDQAFDLLRLQLDGVGFRIVRATSAEAALLLAAQECPDLITVDILLPGMDGWEFLERFKQHPQFAAVPVVIVSIVADRGRGLSLGAAHVLQKPVARDDFSAALQALGFGAPGDGHALSALVVDDDPKARQLLQSYLDAAGYQVQSASGGQQGIDMARQHHPDLILLDLMMPDVTGFDVVEVLKTDPSTASIPIIILTAKQMTLEDRAKLAGDVQNVIEKSDFNHGNFIGEVRRALSGRGREHGAHPDD